jgi:hypothetical protein
MPESVQLALTSFPTPRASEKSATNETGEGKQRILARSLFHDDDSGKVTWSAAPRCIRATDGTCRDRPSRQERIHELG